MSYPAPGYPAPPAPPRGIGPRLWVSIAVIGVGVAIGIASVVAIVIPLVGTFTSRVHAVPTTVPISMHLDHAHYTVYQRTGTRSGFGSSTLDPPAVQLLPAFVTVLAPDGSFVPVSLDDHAESVTRGSAIYSGALTFETPTSGEYELRFSDVDNHTTVFVARSLHDTIRSVLVWFATGALGGAVLICGIVMLIVGATRRGRAKRAMYGGGGYPVGPWPGPSSPWDPPPAPPPPPPPPGPQPGGWPPPG